MQANQIKTVDQETLTITAVFTEEFIDVLADSLAETVNCTALDTDDGTFKLACATAEDLQAATQLILQLVTAGI